MNKIEISIIVPTKDRPEQLLKCLKNVVKATTNYSKQIIVVNDSHKPLNISEKSIVVIRNSGNGVAAARNLGALNAKSNLLLFLDDDMLICEHNIKSILEFHKMRQNCALNLNWVYPNELLIKSLKTSFGRYLNNFGFNSLEGWCKNLNEWNDSKLFRSSGITSQNLSLSKNTFKKIGGYNEIFPLAGFEDHDFSKRLKLMQIESYIDPLSMTYHNETDRQDLNSWLKRKYRGAITRKIATNLGHSDLVIQYSNIKILLLQLLVILKPIVIAICEKFEFPKSFDPLYFQLINYLLAASIFEGYTSKDAEKYLIDRPNIKNV